MKKKVKYLIILLFVTLFFLTFIPVKKIDTPKNYWDSEEYSLISTELDSLFKIYSEYVFKSDTCATKEVPKMNFLMIDGEGDPNAYWAVLRRRAYS